MARRLMHGIFVTFEGGDGAGKSTLIDEVARHLASRGLNVVQTREPGGTRLGEWIRAQLLEQVFDHPLSPQAELCLFLAARAQHIEEVIRPALDEGKVVLCDRFNDSTIAYQGMGRGLGTQEVSTFCHFISQEIQPHLTLYLDVDPGIALSRARQNRPRLPGMRGYDRIEREGMDFHEKVQKAFREIHDKEPNRFVLLDATQPPAVLQAEAIRRIDLLLK